LGLCSFLKTVSKSLVMLGFEFCFHRYTTWCKVLKISYSQLMNVHSASDVRLTAIHTAEPLETGPSHPEVENPIAKLRKYKLPGSNQILAELIQSGGETLWSQNDKFIHSFNMEYGRIA
jgi:hypothetical protein